MSEAAQKGGELIGAPRPALRALGRAVAVVALLAALAGCGGGGPDPSRTARRRPTSAGLRLGQIPGVRQRLLGSGPRSVVILTSARPVKVRSTVIFLHGWYPYPPADYGPWLAHLVERGSTVIYPAIQDRRSRASAALADMLSGLRRAFAALPSVRRPVLVAGVTTGAVLAADFAAGARAAHLPVPAAIFAVYPGRNPGVGVIPAVDPARIASSTRLVVVGGRFDPVLNGAAEARRMLRSASGIPSKLRIQLSAADPDAGGPEEAGAAARRSFWAPLDRLIIEARSEARRNSRSARK